MFWGVYWAASAGVAFIPFILGLLVLEFLPYSLDLGYGLWALSLILLMGAGYGAFSISLGEEAKKRGYSWRLYFWLSIGLTPFLVGLIVPNLPKRIEPGSALPRVCIDCQKPLLPEARFCSLCGRVSALLAPPPSPQGFISDFEFAKSKSGSARIANLLGGSGFIIGAIVLTSLFFQSADFTDNDELSVMFGIQGFLPLATTGAGLAVLGVIFLTRGLRLPKQ